MNCVQCHDPHGRDIFKTAGGLAMARLNETCAQCHREQTKPVVFEHPALREGCASCHNPHGSVNPKLLTVRDSNLCLRCHAQVQGAAAGAGILVAAAPTGAASEEGDSAEADGAEEPEAGPPIIPAPTGICFRACGV